MARDRSLAYLSSFRKKRFEIVLGELGRIVAEKGSCSVIDVGGEFDYWRPFLSQLQGMPIKVLVCNLQDRSQGCDDARFSSRHANACDLGFAADGEFDLAHSNSVIEHVGRWPEMASMAGEIRRVAKSYYVQTPYYWFPMEPHFRTVGYQWLPEQWRARLHARFELGHYPKASTLDQAMRWIQGVVLLDAHQLQALFPDAEIAREKVLGVTKSIMAIRRAPAT